VNCTPASQTSLLRPTMLRDILALLLSVTLASCAAAPTEPHAMKRTMLSAPTLGVGGESLTQVTFANGASCGEAHLSVVWYSATDLTVCWDKDGKETFHDVQLTTAFGIMIGILGATAGAAAILAGKL
jgi:hypothetical protein